MRQITEYLLSKKHKANSEKYFILWPSYDIYEKLMEQYEDEMIRIGLDYWILSEAETLDVLEEFPIGYIKEHLRMFAIPNNYDVGTLRNELIQKKKDPRAFPEIDINDILK